MFKLEDFITKLSITRDTYEIKTMATENFSQFFSEFANMINVAREIGLGEVENVSIFVDYLRFVIYYYCVIDGDFSAEEIDLCISIATALKDDMDSDDVISEIQLYIQNKDKLDELVEDIIYGRGAMWGFMKSMHKIAPGLISLTNATEGFMKMICCLTMLDGEMLSFEEYHSVKKSYDGFLTLLESDDENANDDDEENENDDVNEYEDEDEISYDYNPNSDREDVYDEDEIMDYDLPDMEPAGHNILTLTYDVSESCYTFEYVPEINDFFSTGLRQHCFIFVDDEEIEDLCFENLKVVKCLNKENEESINVVQGKVFLDEEEYDLKFNVKSKTYNVPSPRGLHVQIEVNFATDYDIDTIHRVVFHYKRDMRELNVKHHYYHECPECNETTNFEVKPYKQEDSDLFVNIARVTLDGQYLVGDCCVNKVASKDENEYSITDRNDAIVRFECLHCEKNIEVNYYNLNHFSEKLRKIGTNQEEIGNHIILELLNAEREPDFNHIGKLLKSNQLNINDITYQDNHLWWVLQEKLDDNNFTSHLKDVGMDLETRNKNGSTILLSSIMMDFDEAAKNLILLGADVNAINKFGNIALESTDNEELIELLLEHGAKNFDDLYDESDIVDINEMVSLFD